MVIEFYCEVDAKTYADKGRDYPFPNISSCPICQARNTLHRHGFYARHALPVVEGKIVICRLKCPSCSRTCSLIPHFLIPYYQHTLHHILAMIDQALHGLKTEAHRQRTAFYLKRFQSQLRWVQTFFRDQGETMKMTLEKETENHQMLERIRSFGESSFLRQSMGHLGRYFLSRTSSPIAVTSFPEGTPT